MNYWLCILRSELWDVPIEVYFSRRSNKEPTQSEIAEHLHKLGLDGRKLGKDKKDEVIFRSGSMLLDAAHDMETGVQNYSLQRIVVKALP